MRPSRIFQRLGFIFIGSLFSRNVLLAVDLCRRWACLLFGPWIWIRQAHLAGPVRSHFYPFHFISQLCDWLHQSYFIIKLSLNLKPWYQPKWPTLVLACCSSFLPLELFWLHFWESQKAFAFYISIFLLGGMWYFFSSIMLNKLHFRLWHLYLSSCFKGSSMNILCWMRLYLHELLAEVIWHKSDTTMFISLL